MNNLRRVFISIIRRKKESVLYLLITAVLMSLLCSSLLCYRASSSSVKVIKEELGSTIKIKGNFSVDPNYRNLPLPAGYSYQDVKNEAKDIVKVLKEYAKDDRVVYTDYSLIKMMALDTQIGGFSASYDLPVHDDKKLSENYDEVNALIKQPGKFTDLMMLYYYQNTELYGVNSVHNDAFQNTGDKFFYSKLARGRFFTPEEIEEGKHVCLMQQFAGYYDTDMNFHQYEIGDKISVCNVTVNNNEEIVQTDVYTFEIVGQYSMYPSGHQWKKLFVPNKVVEEIQKTDEQLSRENNCYILSDEWASLKTQFLTDDLSLLMGIHAGKKISCLLTPQLKVKDVKYAEEIVKELKEKLPYKDIIVTVDATEYETVTGSVGLLESTSRIFMILCAVVSILVLSLITVISVLRRRHEMGIYLALGEKRKSIIFRIIAEYMIIGILCIGIALAAGNRIAGRIGDDVIKEYKTAHKDDLNHRDAQTMSIIDNFDIKLKKEDVLSVTAISGGIIAVTSLASAFIILTLNPKKILLVE